MQVAHLCFNFARFSTKRFIRRNCSSWSANKKLVDTENGKREKRRTKWDDIDVESLNKCQLELRSGIGGMEAGFFTADLLNMYQGFAANNGWSWSTNMVDVINKPGSGQRVKSDSSPCIRQAVVSIEGEWCYAKLRFEGGIHKIKRQSSLDHQGKIHSCTVSVVVLPEPKDPESLFDANEVRIERIRATGPGGMNVNSKSNAVRITHLPTGISIAEDKRDPIENEIRAYQRLAAILLKRHVDESNSQSSNSRKLQVGRMERGEKIRTYLAKENQVIDHRLKQTLHGIEEFFQGGEKLEQFVEQLMEMYEQEGMESQMQMQQEEQQKNQENVRNSRSNSNE